MHLNDTHPALTVAELMRLLVDEKDLSWEEAWAITQASVSFTNHTLAGGTGKVGNPVLEHVLPRHMQISMKSTAASWSRSWWHTRRYGATQTDVTD